jgi:hypothetical protein
MPRPKAPPAIDAGPRHRPFANPALPVQLADGDLG